MDKFTIKCLGCIVFLLSGILLSAITGDVGIIIFTFVVILVALAKLLIQIIDKL